MFNANPTSTADGYSGAPVVVKTLETTIDMYLATFNTGTDYDVTFEDVCPVGYLRRSLATCINFGTLLTNLNTVKIKRVNRGGASDFTIPNNLFGVLSVDGVWGKAAGVVNPPLAIEENPVIWSWRGRDNILPSAKPAQSVFNLSLSDSTIATKEIVTIDGSLALHVVAASTYPKIQYNFTLPRDHIS